LFDGASQVRGSSTNGRTFTEIAEAGLMSTVKTQAEVKVGCAQWRARFFG
jgi:hypothetical protein